MSNPTPETTSLLSGLKSKVQIPEGRLESLAHGLGEQVGARASNVVNTTSDFVQTGREYVQDNPIKGVAIAAASGLVLGTLLTLAMRRK